MLEMKGPSEMIRVSFPNSSLIELLANRASTKKFKSPCYLFPLINYKMYKQILLYLLFSVLIKYLEHRKAYYMLSG